MRTSFVSLVGGAVLAGLSGAAAAQGYAGITISFGAPIGAYGGHGDMHSAPPAYHTPAPQYHYQAAQPHRREFRGAHHAGRDRHERRRSHAGNHRDQ